MKDPDRDRIHADLLPADKRGKAALKKAEAARDRMASRLADGYQKPAYLAVGRDEGCWDVAAHGDTLLPTDTGVAAVVRECNNCGDRSPTSVRGTPASVEAAMGELHRQLALCDNQWGLPTKLAMGD